MRRRLVAALVGLTVAVIALYGVPRALYLQDLVESSAVEALERSAGYAGAAADQALVAEGVLRPDLFRSVAGPGETVVYQAPDGTVTLMAGDGDVTDEELAVSRPLTNGGTVTVTLAEDVVAAQYRAAVLPLALLGLTLLPVVAMVGLLLARRLSRPFDELAEVAQELGTGRLDLEVPRYRIPEAEAIGRALQHSAERLDTLIRRERELATHASHELRTPITAVRLTLEDLALWPQTDPLVAEELDRVVAEVDRLSLAVTGLLDESRAVRMLGVEPADLGAVVAESVDRWAPVADTVGLTLRRAPTSPGLLMQLPLHAVTRAVDLLLQHACEVADADLSARAVHRGTHLGVEVTFSTDGADPAASDACDEAAELAASVGGRLAIDTGEHGTVRLVLMLPTAEPEQRIA